LNRKFQKLRKIIDEKDIYSLDAVEQVHKAPRLRINDSQDVKKVNVSVCVGTGCYLRGSYYVLDKFIKLTKQMNLEDYIDLKGTFCLEQCDNGVSVKVNDEIITGINEENAEHIFKTHIAMKTNPPWALR